MLHIKSPFLTAGRMLNWPREYGIIGIGINTKYLKGEGNFEMKISSNPNIWFINKIGIITFCKQYNSFYKTKTVKLAVIPWKILSKKIPNQNRLL